MKRVIQGDSELLGTLTRTQLLESLFRLDRPFFWPAAGLNPEAREQHLLDQHKSKKLLLENDRKHDANVLENSHNSLEPANILEKIYNAVPKMVGWKFVYAHVYGKVPGAAGNKDFPGTV